MKKLYAFNFFLIVVLLSGFSCKNEKPPVETSNNTVEAKITKNDLSLPNGIFLKDVEYVLKIDKVNFTVQVALKKDSSVVLKFNFYQVFTFNEHLMYQKQLIKAISKDFPLTKAKSLHLGRLIYTGDLTLAVTKQVIEAGWDGRSYPELKSILDSSLLVKTYGDFFAEFGLNVSGTTFEKAFLTDASVINQYAKTDTRPENMPVEVLDAICWLLLEPVN